MRASSKNELNLKNAKTLKMKANVIKKRSDEERFVDQPAARENGKKTTTRWNTDEIKGAHGRLH